MVRYALLLALLLAGCASPTAGAPSPTPLTPVPVTVMKSGGIAGVRETVTIDASGKWTRTDRAGTAIGGRLTREQVTQLQRLTLDPVLASEALHSVSPTNCNDAFEYTVTVGAATVRYTDCPSDSFQPTATRAIVAFVEEAVPA